MGIPLHLLNAYCRILMHNTFRILEGHFLDVAKQIPDASVHVCVTSPPYYGLRTYQTEPQIWDAVAGCDHQWVNIKQYKDSWRRGESAAQHHSAAVGARRIRSREEVREGRWTHTEYCELCSAWRGELGQEPSPALYIKHLVQIFSEVHRVLHPAGTLWVNLGDAHYNYRPGKHDDARAQGFNRQTNGNARDIPSFTPKRGYKIDGLKEKDLIGLPWMLGFAMREFGWYWRSTIVWHKPNPLSESVEDRPTKTWEPVLLFTKSESCFYDKWAITEPPTGNAHPRGRMVNNRLQPSAGSKTLTAESRNNDSFRTATAGVLTPGGRNKRDVWVINVQGYPEDHFAAYPEELPEIPIKAGTSEVGCCQKCLEPWKRIVLKAEKPLHENETLENRWRRAASDRGIDIDNAITGDSITLGWKRLCNCYAGAPVPCTVLDPFTGRGTTGVVAIRYGRNFTGAELQPRYVPMIKKNIRGEAPLWVREEHF